MKTLPAPCILLPLVAALAACSPSKPAVEAARPVRTVELRYESAPDKSRYVGTVQARHQVDEAFRVGGKVAQRRVEIGQAVRAGDVIAVLDDTDYRLAEEGARQQAIASAAQARQADSDRQRLAALKVDGSVSASDEERADSNAHTSRAAAEGDAKKLDIARNRLGYTVLRASQAGVVTAVRFEVGQVVAEGQQVVSIANDIEPEVIVDVPEDQVAAFKASHYRASLAQSPDDTFDAVLRELSPQAAAQTRTYRARLKPATPRRLPLGATATVLVERTGGPASVAVVPAAAVTQADGKPALWVIHRADAGAPQATVALMPVDLHGYRNEDVLVSGPPPGELVVTAGVQKMAPGLKVALAPAPGGDATRQAAR